MRLILLLLALLLAGGCDRQKAEIQQGEAAIEGVPTKGVDRSRHGQAAPDTMFKDPDGGEIGFADFQGVPVLVNLWATWCAPCVKELPTLDTLAKRTDGRLGVIAISQDMAPQASVRAFLEKLQVGSLGAYHDDQMALSGSLDVQVLPTTILFDAEGREVWRYVGDFDWSGEEASRLLAEAGADGRG